MTYILQPDGTIKNLNNKDLTASRKKVRQIKGTLGYEIYSSSNKEDIDRDDSLTKKISDFKKFVSESGEDIAGESDFYKRRVEIEKIKSFDFIDDENEEKIFSYGEFNNLDNIYAEEFEILTGWSPAVDDDSYFSTRLAPLFEFFSDAFQKILILEAITEANRFIFNDSNVVEDYSFRYGSYSIKGVDVFSKFIFEKLNYPKEKLSIDERLASFAIGFAVWLKPDRVLDVDQLIKEASSDFGEEINNFLELTSKVPAFYNNPLLMIIMPLVFYAVETLLAVNGSLEKRVKLLFNKFSKEKIWVQKILYSDNAKDSESDISKFFKEFDLYSTKFYIERIHVGSKILRNVLQKASYLPKFTKESPFSRVAGGKFYKTTDLEISSNKDGNYNWSALNSKQQEYKFEQPTRLRALPQGLLLNKKLIHNIFANSGKIGKETPLVNIGKDLLQNFYIPSKLEGKRLPGELVKKIENHLENEYMPFYFHDLRTNEILSFHAFLSSLTDKISPKYSPVEGLGRVEAVQVYSNTSRNIDFSFDLVATSKKDFDLMWYQVNKLMSMCYPQFSKGVPVTDVDESGEIINGDFRYPFSQVPTSAPMIRLRIGDVIKSNYSPTNIARLHELENNIDIPKKAVVEGNEASGIDIEDLTPGPEDSKKNPSENIEEDFKKFIRETKDSDENFVLLPGLYRDNFGVGNSLVPFKIDIFQGYVNVKNPLRVELIDSNQTLGFSNSLDVKVIEEESKFKDTVLTVDSRSVIKYFPESVTQGNNNTMTQKLVDTIRNPKDDTNTSNEGVANLINNPITKAFESGAGRGLAGFITTINTSNFMEIPWETSEIGSRGPMRLKITIGFTPISDITPGLDHTGMMRAPVYNIGRINNEMFGDVYDDVGSGINSGLDETKRIKNKNQSIE
tara:strand:- start:214 stop:2928 length:2715 start_codon:yes stop_codon:yes gene_type:complete